MGFDRDVGDEPAPAWRDTAPDVLTPIDDAAPVSGHVPASDVGASPATIMSHTIASSQPPPSAKPRTAATSGFRIRLIRSQRWNVSPTVSVVGVWRPSSGMSAPAAKARSPAPVITIARQFGS